MGPKGPGAGGAPLAAMSFVPEGDPSMMGGPPAIEAEAAEGEGGGEGFSGDPSDFADDAGTFELKTLRLQRLWSMIVHFLSTHSDRYI